MSEITLIHADLSQVDLAARYSDAMNAEDGHPASPNNKQAIESLIKMPEWGYVQFIALEGQFIGYVALCSGYSIEYGGRDICLDEFYIEPAHRGKGYGLKTLELLKDQVKAQGYISFYLEAMEGNPALKLYEKAGFKNRYSHLLTINF